MDAWLIKFVERKIQEGVNRGHWVLVKEYLIKGVENEDSRTDSR